MVDFHIIIPARFASTRLPEKLIRPLAGKVLLQHTYERALAAGAASVTIATDHEQIANTMQAAGAKVLMTSNQHETGTDRLAEAIDLLGLPADAVIVNLQGDEPLMPASLINQLAENLVHHQTAAIATLCEPIRNLEELFNLAVTKVVRDAHHFALYFSRAPIPWQRDVFTLSSQQTSSELPANIYFRHLGIYAYRASFLRAYQQLTPAPMESFEKLEQLRALYHGYKIHVDVAKDYCPPGVDTLDDFNKLVTMLG